MDCKTGRVSWTVLAGCDPKGCYKYKETKEMWLWNQRRESYFLKTAAEAISQGKQIVIKSWEN